MNNTSQTSPKIDLEQLLRDGNIILFLDEIHTIVYGKEFRDAMADEDVKDILSSLYDACLESLRDVKSQYMEVFRSVSNPNPMEQVAQGILDILEKVKPLLNQEEVLNMLRQLHAEEAEKKWNSGRTYR